MRQRIKIHLHIINLPNSNNLPNSSSRDFTTELRDMLRIDRDVFEEILECTKGGLCTLDQMRAKCDTILKQPDESKQILERIKPESDAYLLIRFRFRFGTAANFFHCVRLESVFVLVTKEKVGRHPMPPTSDRIRTTCKSSIYELNTGGCFTFVTASLS